MLGLVYHPLLFKFNLLPCNLAVLLEKIVYLVPVLLQGKPLIELCVKGFPSRL